MLDSLPTLKRQLEKIERSQKINPQTKIERYQKKILQLLIREKTTILQNKQLQKQLIAAKCKISQVEQNCKNFTKKLRLKQSEAQKLTNEIQRLSQTVQNLETQIRMGHMGRLNEQERYAQLLQEYKALQVEKEKVKNQLKNSINENNKLKKEIQQTEERNKQQVQKLNEKQALKQNLDQLIFLGNKKAIRKDTNHRSPNWVNLNTKADKQLQNITGNIFSKDQILSKLQQKLNLSLSTENNLKQKLNESLQSNSNLQSKLQQLTKQIHLLKLKNKQYQETLYMAEIEKGQQSLEFDKLDKENKKLKKIQSQLQEKFKQIEQEKSDLQTKYQQLNKNYKNIKKQLQKFKDQLSQATDYQTGFKSKIDKLQLTIKDYRQKLQQKDSKIQKLQESFKNINNILQVTKTQALQAKINAEEIRRKYDVVAEARNLAEQKLVLQRQQNTKSLSSMIKEKDLCYRQNYKLLQLLEVKDKTLQKIIKGLRNNQQLQKQLTLEISGKQNNTKKMIQDVLSKDIKGNKDRVRIIEEHLEKYKN